MVTGDPTAKSIVSYMNPDPSSIGKGLQRGTLVNDAKHDIEVSSRRSSVEKGEDSGNKQKTRKRKTRE